MSFRYTGIMDIAKAAHMVDIVFCKKNGYIAITHDVYTVFHTLSDGPSFQYFHDGNLNLLNKVPLLALAGLINQRHYMTIEYLEMDMEALLFMLTFLINVKAK